MPEREEDQDGSVVTRVARLPLIRSAYQIISFAYQDVKTLHPVVGYVCDVSERGLRAVSGAAVLGVSPLLKLVEPQIAVVNNAALRVVDELEDRLPVLDQPADEVVTDFRNKLVSGVGEARAQARGRVQNALNRTQTLVRDVYEATSLGVLSLGTLGVWELLRLGAELTITRAEDLVDRYLPEEDEDALGVESCGSDEMEDVEAAESGLISRFWALAGVIFTRSFNRLNSLLDQFWAFFHGSANLVSSIPTQLKRCTDAIMEAVIVPNISKGEPKQKVTPKKKQGESSLRSGRVSNRRRLLSSPQSSTSIFRVFTNDKRVLTEIEGGRVRGRDRRRQSLDSSFNPPHIQED